MPLSRTHHLQILRYWRNVEFFRVFDLDDLIKRHKPIFEIKANKENQILPWLDLEKAKLNPEYEYSFDLFFSPFLVSDVLKILAETIPRIDAPLPDYRAWEIPGKSCVGRLSINSKGEFDFNDTSISTLPWALRATQKKKPLSIQDFDEYGLSLLESIQGIVDDQNLNNSRKVNYSALRQIADLIASQFEIPFLPNDLMLVIVPIRLRKKPKAKEDEHLSTEETIEEIPFEDESDTDSERERKDRGKKRKVDILNSFYLRDLERAALTDIQNTSPALNSYLSLPQRENLRFDFRTSDEGINLKRKISEENISHSWPAERSFELTENQKAALNWVLKGELNSIKTPLIGVNGPPGTGKTTLIRDLVASIVIHRAKILSNLDSPQDAFLKGDFVFSPEGKEISYKYRKLIPQLHGFGVVLASSNNGAVENVSKELPVLSALPKEHKNFKYLSGVTKSYRLACEAKDINDWWGIISLPLGKSSNRRKVSRGLFWGERDLEKIERRKAVGAQTLKEWRSKAPNKGTLSFKEAQKSFLALDTSRANYQFFAALTLHEAWLREVPQFDSELRALAALISRPSGIPSHAARELWEILFLISPLISTTLASVERMFGTLEANTIPFVVIDEAGQALPQSGVGIILRAKQAFILGDQQQLKPIFSLPNALDEYLQEGLSQEQVTHFGAATSSIQSLADNQTALGTFLKRSSEEVWVGLPLTVHRRCDEPMFSISNKLSYDELMKFETPKRGDISSLGASCWVSVKGQVSKDQWVPAQGSAVQNLLSSLLKINPNPDCFFISPFRAVKDSLRELVKETISWERPDSSLLHDFSRRVGTIHTFQGREADIVFLILGCDESREGAADWAGVTPNLCNVAITRAKRFLYVIGDVDLWHRRGAFSDLQKGLPVVELGDVLSRDFKGKGI